MTVIIHASDFHGHIPKLPKLDGCVVFSGDMLPNSSWGNTHVEQPFQTSWLQQNAKKYADVIGDRPLIWCAGNHDFIRAGDILAEAGIDIHEITLAYKKVRDIWYLGSPFVPTYKGEWAWERSYYQMDSETIESTLLTGVPCKLDVLVTHAPPYGIHDLTTDRRQIGRHDLRTILDDVPLECLPKALLCGHVHESKYISKFRGMIVSQAATTVHCLNL